MKVCKNATTCVDFPKVDIYFWMIFTKTCSESQNAVSRKGGGGVKGH